MKKLIFSLILIVVGPVLYFLDGTIIQDFQLRSEQLRPALIPTTDRKCRSKIHLFHQCSFKYELNGQKIRQDYDFFAFGAPESVILLKGSQSGGITSDVGIHYFWNRVLTISAFSFLGVLTLFVAMRRLTSAVPASAASRDTAHMEYEAVPQKDDRATRNSAGTPRRKAFGRRRALRPARFPLDGRPDRST